MQTINFIDFCAGIGGGRIGLENLGMNCLGFSEIDKDAEITYREFFGNDEVNYGDLMQINPDDLPDFDFMVGGFPCQTFSIMGTRCGLDDEERGQIIYGLVEILKAKNVKYFILENVKGLINHDKGNTLKVVLELLEGAGYEVYHKVLNSLDFAVPQMRERIYFVGIRKDLIDDNFSYEFPTKHGGTTQTLEECLIDNDEKLIFDENLLAYATFLKYLNNKYNKGKYVVDELLSKEYRVLDTRQSDLRIYEEKTPTLRKGRHGILYVRDGKLRKLSGYEALLLQKFPRRYADKVRGKISNSKLLQQTGNAMTSSVIEEIGKNIIKALSKMDKKQILIERGSKTAKDGFKNETFVVEEFNSWKESELAQSWLKAMSYNLKEIERVEATKVKGSYKADVQVAINIEIKLKNLTDIQNLQVKLVSNPKGFNQIDKRWLKSYQELWDIPSNVYELLQYFTGEKKPKIENPKDERRMFAYEFLKEEQELLLHFLNDNKTLIVNDILKGRGKFSAEWMLVILKLKDAENIKWALEPMNKVLNHFGNGEILITPRGSFKIGNITIQRKGGDNGRESANMLQFKINPAELVKD